jgi:hypothetical protein
MTSELILRATGIVSLARDEPRIVTVSDGSMIGPMEAGQHGK